jgi:hypothetical protein
MTAAAEKGKKVLLKEEYDIIESYILENTVVLEVIWTVDFSYTSWKHTGWRTNESPLCPIL